jgi:hypothetical protein
MSTSNAEGPTCSVGERPSTPPESAPLAQVVGERFVQSLAAKDASALKALLQPGIDFRALTPGKFWEATDHGVIVDETILGTWFSGERRIIETLRLETEDIEELCRVGYRFKVDRPDGEFVIEQQAYFKTDGKTISWLRILCSGFLPCA